MYQESVRAHAMHKLRIGLCLLLPLLARADDDSSVFGHATPSEAALIGVLYDTKQTYNHKPTYIGVGDGYTAVIDNFIARHWDEAVLNKFYRVSKPLYTTQIFVPNMNADNAPKAFGAEKLVQPSGWLIHYKGQVSPPTTGVYRFWGSGDDVMAVAVNGKTVLVANRFDSPFHLVKWKSAEPDGAQAADGPLHAGDWMPLRADQIVDLDVVIGERPGGYFNAFLLVEKQGDTYMKDQDGRGIFPIFQVAPYNTPDLNNVGAEPRFAKGFPTWKSYQ